MITKLRLWLKLSSVFIALSWYLGWLLLISFLKGKSVERGFAYRRKFCKSALSILGIEYLLLGSEYQGVCLYVSNHRSMLDPLIQLAYINAFIVSKAEVGRYPVLGKGAKETGIILVDRTDPISRKSTLGVIEKTLLSGYPVLIYPEGTTHAGDLTGEFKRGAIEMAQRNGIPIVPLMIEYPDAGYYWGNSTLLNYFERIFSVTGRHMVLGQVGQPILNTGEDKVDEIKSRIHTMMLEARSNRS